MQLRYENHGGYIFTKPRNLDFEPHIHNAVEIVYLTGGSSLVLCGRQKRMLQAGELFIAFPNQIHGYERSRDIQGYLLVIPLRPYLISCNHVLMNKVAEESVISGISEELQTLLKLAYGEKQTASDRIMESYFQLIVEKILAQLSLSDAEQGAEEIIKEILLYVNAHYTENLTRKEIAQAVGYHESYISHLFSGILKTSIPGYINSLRMHDASRLLAQTDLPVSRIAEQLGFGTVRNFNRVFLKETGSSPKAYRMGLATQD